MKKDATFSDIVAMTKADPERFASAVLQEEPTLQTGSSVRYFENQSLVVNTSGPSQGRFYSFTDSDAKGDMLDLVRWIKGLGDDKQGRKESLDIAKAILGVSDGRIDIANIPNIKSDEERRKDQEQINAKKIRTANWLWSMGSETEGREEAQAYLRGRAITIMPGPDTLRFRRLTHADLEKMGVARTDIPSTPVTSLIFAVRTPNGQITAVQQILVTNGRKVSFANPKRTNGLLPGASVLLGDPSKSDQLILVEGPETGLSLHEATGLPTMITLGKANFTNVALPKETKTLLIASDMEPTGVGLASSLQTAQFWKRDGIEKVGIALPRLNDGDFNDVHQKDGAAAVAACIEHSWFAPERDDDGTILVSPDARAAFHAWAKTGIEVAAKVPARKDGKFLPMTLDSLVQPHHNRVLIVANPAIQIKDELLRKRRPDLEIVTLHEDSRKFRKLARNPEDMQAAINATDMYAPKGAGTVEPVFFALRREDADALDLPGHKAIAIRSRAVDRIDLGFMKGRDAIVAPLGEGTDHDRKLTERLEQAGANTTRLTWQIFRGDETLPRIIRRRIPDTFGASNAASEGWSGEALRDLIDISRANHAQISRAPAITSSTRRRSTEPEL